MKLHSTSRAVAIRRMCRSKAIIFEPWVFWGSRAPVSSLVQRFQEAQVERVGFFAEICVAACGAGRRGGQGRWPGARGCMAADTPPVLGVWLLPRTPLTSLFRAPCPGCSEGPGASWRERPSHPGAAKGPKGECTALPSLSHVCARRQALGVVERPSSLRPAV